VVQEANQNAHCC